MIYFITNNNCLWSYLNCLFSGGVESPTRAGMAQVAKRPRKQRNFFFIKPARAVFFAWMACPCRYGVECRDVNMNMSGRGSLRERQSKGSFRGDLIRQHTAGVFPVCCLWARLGSHSLCSINTATCAHMSGNSREIPGSNPTSEAWLHSGQLSYRKHKFTPSARGLRLPLVLVLLSPAGRLLHLSPVLGATPCQ